MRVLSTLAVQGVLSGLLPTPGASTGSAPEPVFEPTALLAQRVRRGEHFDVAILTSDGIDALIRDDLLDARSKVDVAVSKVGIAVRAGAAKPDISTLETVRALLLAVPSLCYSKAGASGIFFAKVIRQLGIADEVERKATIIPSGFTAEQIVNGRCEIAIQQLSELLVVPGIDIVGPLPEPIQESLTFSAAVARGAHDAQAAARFVQSIVHVDLAPLYALNGLSLIR